MPELPEVETIARQLDTKLVGKKITNVEVLRSKSFVGKPVELKGLVIKEVCRVSKMIIFRFKKTDLVMLGHMKMTGQLVWRPKKWDKNDLDKEIVGGHPTADWVQDLPGKHTRVVIHFSDESQLFFNDLRVFGWLKLANEVEVQKQISKLPPDVTDKRFTVEFFSSVLNRSKRAVKVVIMDQSLIGGVGNIYANDALFEAKIDPRRPATSLLESEVSALFNSIKNRINLGIQYGGASAANFVHTTGLGGKYQDHFLVYKKDGDECPRGNGKIKKITVGGRGTYYCPNCQK